MSQHPAPRGHGTVRELQERQNERLGRLRSLQGQLCVLVGWDRQWQEQTDARRAQMRESLKHELQRQERERPERERQERERQQQRQDLWKRTCLESQCAWPARKAQARERLLGGQCERIKQAQEEWEREQRARVVQALIDSGAGREIPQELFANILGHLCMEVAAEHAPQRALGDQGIEDAAEYPSLKNALGQCALVCRYWAQICQPTIFHTLELSCANDVRELQSMVTQPANNIARHVKVLPVRLGKSNDRTLDISKPLTPWFHKVPLLCAKLPSCNHYELFLYDSSYPRYPKPPPIMQSIHWYLPRTLPSHSRGLRNLYFTNVTFPSFLHLIHLLDELHDLSNLYCKGLRWFTAPPLMTMRADRPRSSQLDIVELDECRNVDEHARWLLSVYRAPVPSRLTFPIDVLAALALFLKIITEESTPTQPVLRGLRSVNYTKVTLAGSREGPNLVWSTDLTRDGENFIMLDYSNCSPTEAYVEMVSKGAAPRFPAGFAPWPQLVTSLRAKLPSLYHYGVIPGDGRCHTRHDNVLLTPPAHFRALRRLYVAGSALSSFADLVYLLDELHDLRNLYCKGLRWSAAPPLATLRAWRIASSSSQLDSVELEDCHSLDEHALWLLSVYRAPAQSRLECTIDVLSALALFLMPHVDRSLWRTPSLRASRRIRKNNLTQITLKTSQNAPRLTWSIDPVTGIDNLIALDSSNRDPTSGYIAQFSDPGLEAPGHSASWSCLVASLCAKLPPCYRYENWDRNGALRTIFLNLPLTPPKHYKALRELHIDHVLFASFSDLIHFLDGLQDLQELYCKDLRWSDTPPLTALRTVKSRPSTSPLERLKFEDCNVDLYLLWLLFFYRAPTGNPLSDVDKSIISLTRLLKNNDIILERLHTLDAARTMNYARAVLQSSSEEHEINLRLGG